MIKHFSILVHTYVLYYCTFVIYYCNRRFIYKFLNVCPFDYTAVAGSGKVGP